jgi:hypothetical protein
VIKPKNLLEMEHSSLLIKAEELKCGAFGSFNRELPELTKLFFVKPNLRECLDNAVI